MDRKLSLNDRSVYISPFHEKDRTSKATGAAARFDPKILYVSKLAKEVTKSDLDNLFAEVTQYSSLQVSLASLNK